MDVSFRDLRLAILGDVPLDGGIFFFTLNAEERRV